MRLRVVQAFGGHSVGDEITDADAVLAIHESDHANFVVAVADPVDPDDEPAIPPESDAPKE